MIGIVDYGMGNLGSIRRKLDRIKQNNVISDNPDILSQADKLILPGVGHFSKAVDELKKRCLWDFLNQEVLENKKPVLGICLGMQLMAAHSEEGDCEGFGWFDATVVRFHVSDKLRYKIPHMGWNDVSLLYESPLFTNVDMSQGFYFVHSYHIKCNNKHEILGTTTFDYPFVSAIVRENIVGMQFHPEKSHDAGEMVLRNFCEEFFNLKQV